MPGRRERLADNPRTNHMAVTFDELAVRPVGEQHLRKSGHDQRMRRGGRPSRTVVTIVINIAAPRYFLMPMMPVLHARPSAVMNTSMALMPTNGAMMPPTP